MVAFDDNVSARTQGLRRIRNRIRYGWPHQWPLVAAFVVLIFFFHFALGANARELPITASALFAGLGAVTLLTVTGWAQFYFSSLLAVAGGLFAITVGVGVIQWLPGGLFGQNPFWELTDAPGRLTLDADATLRETIKLVGLAAAFLIGVTVGRSNRRAQLFFSLFLGFACLYAIAAFLDFTLDPERMFGAQRVFHFDRLSGTLLSANTAATLFGVFTIVAAARLAQAAKEAGAVHETTFAALESTIRRGALAIFALSFSLICLVLTASRGGVLVTFLALGMFVLWEMKTREARRRGPSLMLLLIGGVLVGGMVLAFGGAAVVDRLASAPDAATARLAVLEVHWRAFAESPFWGHGLGSFDRLNDIHQTATNWVDLHRINAAHNTYVQWLEEAGLIGALPLFASIIVVHVIIFSGLRRRARLRTWLRAQIVVSLLIAMHAFLEYSLEVPSIALQWAGMLGVAVGLATSSTKRDAVASESRRSKPVVRRSRVSSHREAPREVAVNRANQHETGETPTNDAMAGDANGSSDAGDDVTRTVKSDSD